MAATTRFTPGCDHRIGAGTGASGMRAGFEIEIQRCAARAVAGLFERQHLGMLQPVVGMGAAANDLALRVDNHRADTRIGRGQRDSASRQLQRFLMCFSSLKPCGME